MTNTIEEPTEQADETAPDTLTREDGCDSCGLDSMYRPIRKADYRVDTDAGPILVCHSHHAAHEAAFVVQGLRVTSLVEEVE
jgi:hypothetical protein